MDITFEPMICKSSLERAMGQYLDTLEEELMLSDESAGCVYLDPSYYDCDDNGSCARIARWMHEVKPNMTYIWVKVTY